MANAGRSQMAQAIFNEMKKNYSAVDKNYEAMSAGINPSDEIGAISSRVLSEIGIDISDSSIYYPKKVDEEMLSKAAMVICLDGRITSSDLYGYSIHENWDVKDTYHQDVEIIRKIRNEIWNKCELLISNLYQETKFV